MLAPLVGPVGFHRTFEESAICDKIAGTGEIPPERSRNSFAPCNLAMSVGAEVKGITMLPENRLDKIIFLGVVPVLAAVLGAVAGALMQAQSCSVVGASEIRELLQNAQMNGVQKLDFMKTYLELTDRPWSIARSVINFLTFSGTIIVGYFFVSGNFKR